ncbi:MAG: MotA/TolQ/ExbB proton channel family protein [Phycisphaerales bacterium]|nr:MotA/TolQ/ExbB proton channel family protein [Phycisphaerales bacterium]
MSSKAVGSEELSGTLDSATGDLECMMGCRSGGFTRARGGLWFGISVILTVATFFVLSIWSDGYMFNMMNRCWTNWACALLTYWCLFILLAKWTKTRIQMKALKVEEVFPRRSDWVLSPATAPEVLAGIRRLVARPREFLLFNRLHLALSNLKNIGEVKDVGAVIDSQASSDTSAIDSSYTGIRALIWTIPVLGFIGTVVGLGHAIGNFEGVLMANPDTTGVVAAAEAVTDIREKLTPVIAGLATAFETTLVALVAAVGVQLLMTMVYQGEEALLDGMSDFCNDHVISRLKLTDW